MQIRMYGAMQQFKVALESASMSNMFHWLLATIPIQLHCVLQAGRGEKGTKGGYSLTWRLSNATPLDFRS